MVRKVLKEEFIQECVEKFKDKYNYEYVIYVNMTTKIKIKCNRCGEILIKTPKHFLRREQGCSKCKIIKRDNAKNLKKFIEKAKKIHHNKYNYDNLTEYNCKKVKIYCNRCGMYFNQRPSSHIEGSGHIMCSLRKTQEKFIKESINIHGDKYKYDKTKYIKNNIKVDIYCNKHKYYFKQHPEHHLRGSGCPKCNISKGEDKIYQYFNKNKINHKIQKYHSFLSQRIYFDFYIPDYELYIEYDGRQHFIDTHFFKNGLIENIRNDILKNNFICHKNKKLLRISYKEIDNIDNILNEYLKKSLKNNIYYSNQKLYNNTYNKLNNN